MTDKELRKLKRADLLSIMLEQSREIEQLRQKLNTAEASLRDKTIKIEQAGSIAEASLQLSGVFEAAQLACQQYTQNIAQLSQKQDAICAQREKESRAQAAQILADAEKQAAEQRRETEKKCAEMLASAKAQSQAYWDELSVKLNGLMKEHAEMRRLLSVLQPQGRDEA